MKFYEDANGIFHVGNSVIPINNAALTIQDSRVALNLLNGKKLIGYTDATKLQKENGINYSSVDELITENAGFFK